jgi:hypothetical protein
MRTLKGIGLMVENVDAREYVGQAQAAERLGFDSFWVPEDYVFPGAFSSCAAIAATTRRIKIGTDRRARVSLVNTKRIHHDPLWTVLMWRGSLSTFRRTQCSGLMPLPRLPTEFRRTDGYLGDVSRSCLDPYERPSEDDQLVRYSYAQFLR